MDRGEKAEIDNTLRTSPVNNLGLGEPALRCIGGRTNMTFIIIIIIIIIIQNVVLSEPKGSPKQGTDRLAGG